MNIQVISVKYPICTGGSQIRNFFLLQALMKEHALTIDIFTYGKSPQEEEQVKQSFGKCPLNYHLITSQYPWQRLMAIGQGKIPYLERLINTHLSQKMLDQYLSADVIQIQELEAYAILHRYIKEIKQSGVKIVFDAHNVEFNKFSQELELMKLPKILKKKMLSYIKELEGSAIKNADLVLTCSDTDKNIFYKDVPQAKIVTISNGVDLSQRKPALRNGKTIIFVGSMGYFANEQAIKWYLEKIHPQISKKFPDWSLQIVGTQPPQWLRDAAKEQPTKIDVTGAVPDTRNYLEQATIAICPLLHGSGTRLKILEYMAHSLPIVSTSKGAEGLKITSEENLIIADDPQTFTDAISKIIVDPVYGKKVGERGNELVKSNYDWGSIGNALLHAYSTIIN